jgi:fibronectin-binding autotransporter adhesin
MDHHAFPALRVRLLSSTLLLAIAGFAADPAAAKCVTSGTSTVCDATPPNPQQGPITGGDVHVLNGSIVEDNGTFTPPVVTISPGGTLTSDQGSLILQRTFAGYAVLLNNANASISGTVRTTDYATVGAFVGGNSKLVINAGGLVENLGDTNLPNGLAYVGAGVEVSGTSRVQVDGTIRTTGVNTSGILGATPIGGAFFGPRSTFYPVTIDIGATGLVETGPADAIWVGEGSTVNVAGSVVSHGANGIRASGDPTSQMLVPRIVTVANGGSVVSDQRVAILLASDVTVRGHVSGLTDAIIMGGPNATLTISTTADIHGAVSVAPPVNASPPQINTLNLIAEDAAHPTGQLMPVTNFQQINVNSGNWTAASGTSSFTNAAIAQGASLEVRNPGGTATVQANKFTVNGTLVVNFTQNASLMFVNDPTANALKAASIGGTGGLSFTGPATVTLGGSAPFLAYTGTTAVENGKLLIVGALPGALTIGSGGSASAAESTAAFSVASIANAGSFSFDRSLDGTMLGGVSGTGTFTKNGAGTLTVNGVYADTGPTVLNAGTLRLAGGTDPTLRFTVDKGVLDFAGAATIASLSGASGGTVRISGTTLTLNQAGDTNFAGVLAGTGTFAKAGAGKLTLSGASSFSGTTALSAGTLAVTGTLPSSVAVSGGRLEGTGTIGALTASGGIVAPGPDIATLNVTGTAGFAPGSVFEVQVNAAGAGDRITAGGGASIGGGTVRVLAQDGTYALQTRYTILSAAGGVQGRFDTVTSNLAFLTPSLAYGANEVTLFLTRNDRSFADFGTTPNQRAVAGAVTSLGIASPVFVAVLQTSQDQAPALFDALSGELYASLPAALTDQSRAVQDALAAERRPAADGLSIWGDGFTGRSNAEGGGGIARARGSMQGFIAGIAYAQGGLSARLGGGLGRATIRLPDRQSSAHADSKFVGGDVDYRAGALSLHAGAAQLWHDLTSQRTLPTGLGAAAGTFGARTTRLFAGADYDLLSGPVTVAPFLAYDWARTSVDGFAETGGPARLALGRNRYRADYASGGIRLEGQLGSWSGVTIRPRASLAYRHRLGQSGGNAAAAFAAGGSAFTVAGVGLPKDALDVDAGLALETGRVRVAASYKGSFASRWTDNGGLVSLSIRF